MMDKSAAVDLVTDQFAWIGYIATIPMQWKLTHAVVAILYKPPVNRSPVQESL